MKKIFIIFAVLLGAMYFVSCEDDKEIVTFDASKSTPPEITSPTTAQDIILLLENQQDTALVFEWTEPDLGFDNPVSFLLQMDTVGNNFANPFDLASTSELTASITVGEINIQLGLLGFTAGEPAAIEFRVFATYAPGSGISSDIYTINITPYRSFSDNLYVTGADFGSEVTGDSPLLAGPVSDGNYEGYIYISTDNAEIFIVDDAYNETYGNDGTDTTIIELDGTAIVVPTAGVYRIQIDLGAMTIEVLRTDWGIIGSAVPPYDWSVDVDMAYDTETKLISVTLDLKDAEYKFRPNDSWDPLNFGDDGNDGILDEYGANIPVGEEGNYTISMDLFHAPEYTYTIVKN